MSLNPKQIEALKAIKKSPGIQRKSAGNPSGPHHKTIEGLNARGLITSKGPGWILTSTGEEALKTK